MKHEDKPPYLVPGFESYEFTEEEVILALHYYFDEFIWPQRKDASAERIQASRSMDGKSVLYVHRDYKT